MSIEKLTNELKGYYRTHSFDKLGGRSWRHPVCDLLDDYARKHPGLSPQRLKVAQYQILADNFEPVIFRNSPFYSEMGLKVAEYDGVPGLSAGGWLFQRNVHLFREADPEAYQRYIATSSLGIHLAYGPYVDYDHHCFPFSNVVENGLGGIYAQAEAELENCKTGGESEFIQCTMLALQAVGRIAERFAQVAAEQLETTTDETQRKFLGMISETAKRIPWERPETFYEALCALWFLHEVCASIEGIGMSVIAHLDRLAGPFYRADLAAGRIDQAEGRDLLTRFLIYTDCKLDLEKPVAESFNRGEQGDTLILGGCDADGKEIFNEVTEMTLAIHHEQKLIYPKIHCRVGRNSERKFLDAANRDFVSGRNVISFLNDDCIIPAQVEAGKTIEDARQYVAGGCWEIILDSHEHSAGANCYLNLARIMDLSIHDGSDVESKTGIRCRKIDAAGSFAEVYDIVLGNILQVIRGMCAAIAEGGRIWDEVNPAPFFSACLSDCLKNHKDYTAGGGRYNPHGLPLAGLAILVDSLLAIRSLCFEAKSCSLADLLAAVRADWEGFEGLRAEALRSPHFGDGQAESSALAKQILDDIHANTRDLKNERGGPFQLGLYNYRDVVDWRMVTRATPDGRRQGDFLTQGLTPSRLHHSAEVTTTINSAATLDLEKFPANSVMTLSLPRQGVNLDVLASLQYAFSASGTAMLQLNCVDREELLHAREHPEEHPDLIVRLYGYSARFIHLTPEMQEEFITRNIYGESSELTQTKIVTDKEKEKTC